MKLYLAFDADHQYVGLYDDREKAEQAKNMIYYYEFDLDDRHYWPDDGALMDVESY